MMEILIKRINPPFHLRASNENNCSVDTDASPKIGGQNLGMRPMELLLAGIGSCSTIDVLEILRKQRQTVRDIQISIKAEREEGKVPSLFKKISLHYQLWGEIENAKAEKALELSIEKYCSVAKILEKTAEISYSYQINP